MLVIEWAGQRGPGAKCKSARKNSDAANTMNNNVVKRISATRKQFFVIILSQK